MAVGWCSIRFVLVVFACCADAQPKWRFPPYKDHQPQDTASKPRKPQWPEPQWPQQLNPKVPEPQGPQQLNPQFSDHQGPQQQTPQRPHPHGPQQQTPQRPDPQGPPQPTPQRPDPQGPQQTPQNFDPQGPQQQNPLSHEHNGPQQQTPQRPDPQGPPQPTPQRPDPQGPQQTPQNFDPQGPQQQNLLSHEHNGPQQQTPQRPDPQGPQQTPQNFYPQGPQQQNPLSHEHNGPQQQTPERPDPQEPQQQTPQRPDPQEPQQQTPQRPDPQEPQQQTPQRPDPQEPQQQTPQRPDPQEPQQQTPQRPDPQEPQQQTPQRPDTQEPQQQTPQRPDPQGPQQQTPQRPKFQGQQEQIHQWPEPEGIQLLNHQRPEPQWPRQQSLQRTVPQRQDVNGQQQQIAQRPVPELSHQQSLLRPVLQWPQQQSLWRPVPLWSHQQNLLRPAVTKSPDQQCQVQAEDILQCGSPKINRAQCKAINCCYNGQQCYYGKAVTVQCTKDAQFVLVVSREATWPKINIDSISLLGENDSPCIPVGITSAFAIYQFPVTACGTTLKEESGYVVYENRMVSSFEVGYALKFYCITYSATTVEAVVVKMNSVPAPVSVAALGPLRVELRLAKGPCKNKGCKNESRAFTSYYTQEEFPVVKVLRQPVYVEVRILERKDPNLVLMLDYCWATSSPSPVSMPQWELLIEECPYPVDRYLTTMIPVEPSSGLLYPTHHKRFILEMFTFVDHTLAPQKDLIFIHCSTSVCHRTPGNSCQQKCNRQRRDVAVAQRMSRQTTVVSSGEVVLVDQIPATTYTLDL
uniref:Zona pellucida sperm-binding protein 4 n=1 Tax=Esox lucius TaxID=8010 RepID=A0A6Q2Y0I1_ESOLU